MELADARRSILERQHGIIRVLYIAAVPAILTGFGWLAFVIMAEAHRRFVRDCCDRGVLVKGQVIREGLESFPDVVLDYLPFLPELINLICKWVPLASTYFQYEVNGKTYSKNLFHFSTEAALRDENGESFVIYDPDNPRMASYIIMEQHDKVMHHME